MNLSDDPSDRLIDSLLREQSRGRADEVLLREIAAGLDVAKARMLQQGRAHRRNHVAAAAVVAFLCLIGLSWSAVQRAIGKSRQLEAARKAEALKSERHDLDGKSRPRKDRPSLSLGGDRQIPSDRVPVEKPAVPQPASSVDPREEGLNLRFLAVGDEERSGEIFAHDPDGREGEQGRRIEPRALLSDTGRINFRGGKIVLTTGKDPESLSNPSSIVAFSYVGQTRGRGVMLLLPGTGKPGDPPAQLLFVDDRFSKFPAGSTLLVNASSKDIRLTLGEDPLDCRSGEQVIIKDPPVNELGITSVRGYFQKDDAWRPFVAAAWPQPGPDGRTLQVCLDGKSPEVLMKGIRENLALALASGEEPSAEAVPTEAGGQPEAVAAGEVQMVAKDPEADLARLTFVRSAATKWYVPFGLESEGMWAPRFVGITPLGTRLQNRISALEMLSVGDVFFREGSMAARFKFSGMIEREIISERTGLRRLAKIAQYEDLRGAVPGRVYESISGLPEADLEKVAYQDPTAVFEFVPERGKKSSLEVQVGDHFSLPPGAPQPRYLLKSLDARSVTLEYQNQAGQTKTSTLTLK